MSERDTVTLKGRLRGRRVGPFDGYVVYAEFDEHLVDDRGRPIGEPVRTARRALAKSNGTYALLVPDQKLRSGDTLLRVVAPTGVTVASRTVARSEESDAQDFELRRLDVVPVRPSPTVSEQDRRRFSGRVIDGAGEAAPPESIVVIWARSDAAAAPSAVAIARTAAGGYFSGNRPTERFVEAFAIVGGGSPVALSLEDGALPARMILVVDAHAEPPEADPDCDCPPETPRAPSAEDLAENAETFSADAGRCVDFTVPNRSIDEVIFQAVVRTTQPALNPPRVEDPWRIPPGLLDRLTKLGHLKPTEWRLASQSDRSDRKALASERIAFAATEALVRDPGPARSGDRGISGDLDAIAKPALEMAQKLTPGIDLQGVFHAKPVVTRDDVADDVLRLRREGKQSLTLERSVVEKLTSSQQAVSSRTLLKAEQTSILHRARVQLKRLSRRGASRFDLSDDKQLDWDHPPEDYQATTIAHGHLLSIKQVWRSDGYSMGDLLYSLPLAPGQQKLISVLDWNREEVAERRASRVVEESLVAELSRDRDISDVVNATVSERMSARSRAQVSAVGGGIGGFIGPVVFGAAGGVANANSSASQTSARGTTGSALNRLRDRTMQAASAVRSQRSTVVQTARQGESVRAQTEVVANYNHCHAMTVEYFEILRHLQVSLELAHVQECLFVPFSIGAFDEDKALRWRAILEPELLARRHRSGFASLARVRNNWADSDFPPGRYADASIVHLQAELRMRIDLPRPSDDEDDDFVAENWDAYEDSGLLPENAQTVWERYFGGIRPENRERVWRRRIAPGVAQRLINQLTLTLDRESGGDRSVDIDPTLVSRYVSDRPLLVSLRLTGPLAPVTRANVEGVRLGFAGNMTLPAGAELRVDSANISYRTDHYRDYLVRNRRVLNDLSLQGASADEVYMATPLRFREKRNPREIDRRRAEDLLEHLNEYVEHYHRVLWYLMDPNRRFMLLDGFEAPNTGGKSVASVVENRIIGIVGNSLIMPLAPGVQLDPTYAFADATLDDLKHHYAIDESPAFRVSLPTAGVFAEAVMGQCNSCEIKDDTRFWRFEDEPIPDEPTEIQALSLDSRRTAPPELAPDSLPDGVVGFQQLAKAVDPTGLASAMAALGANNLFKDITGVALNQANAAQAFKSTMKVAQEFASRGASLAQQRFLNKELDRNLDTIKAARAAKLTDKEGAQRITEGLFKRAIGVREDGSKPPTEDKAMSPVMKRVQSAEKSKLRIEKPSGSIEVEMSTPPKAVRFRVSPELVPLRSPSTMTCWAVAGAMMQQWREQASFPVEDFLSSLGDDWLERFQANAGLSQEEFKAFAGLLGLMEEGPQSFTARGLEALLANHGPLMLVGDDGVANNFLVHIRIAVEVSGDGTPDGTEVRLADSATGSFVRMSMGQFAALHESDDTASIGLGGFHF